MRIARTRGQIEEVGLISGVRRVFARVVAVGAAVVPPAVAVAHVAVNQLHVALDDGGVTRHGPMSGGGARIAVGQDVDRQLRALVSGAFVAPRRDVLPLINAIRAFAGGLVHESHQRGQDVDGMHQSRALGATGGSRDEVIAAVDEADHLRAGERTENEWHEHTTSGVYSMSECRYLTLVVGSLM